MATRRNSAKAEAQVKTEEVVREAEKADVEETPNPGPQMVRVKVASGTHTRDTFEDYEEQRMVGGVLKTVKRQRWIKGKTFHKDDELEVTPQEYQDFKFKFQLIG